MSSKKQIAIGLDESGNGNAGNPFVLVATFDHGIEGLLRSEEVGRKGRPRDYVRRRPNRRQARRMMWDQNYTWLVSSENRDKRVPARFGEPIFANDPRMFQYPFRYVGVPAVSRGYEGLWRRAATDVVTNVIETTDADEYFIVADGTNRYYDNNGVDRLQALRNGLINNLGLEFVTDQVWISFKPFADTNYALVNAADFIGYQFYQSLQKRQGWQDLTEPERVIVDGQAMERRRIELQEAA